MKNLFKKLLACCLALCMVLTLCVGALTVSAEDVVYDGTFTIVGDEVTTDDASAVVNYTAQADCGIAAAEINVDIPDGFAIDELELITEDENVEALFAKSADSTEAPEAIYAGDVYGDEEGETLTDVGDVFTYLIRVYADEVEASTAAITLEITYVPTGEKFEVGNHAVTADIESCKNATDPLLNLEVTLTAEIVVTEAHTHNYVGAVTKEATCTEAGVMTYTCTCGEGTYTEEIPVIPHTEETIPAVDATCTTTGLTAGVKCSVCDTVLTAPTEVPALGHDFGDNLEYCANNCGTANPDYEAPVVCEHEWEAKAATPAQGTGTNASNQTTTVPGSITLKCSKCEETTTKSVEYYGRTKCMVANALYESAIALEFSARKDRMQEKGVYTQAIVRFEHDIPGDDNLVTFQNFDDGYDTVKTEQKRDCRTWAYPVKAMQLTETITTNIFVEINGVWYSGDSYGYSVRSYADEILPTVTTEEKTLVVNMLRYGSKMQVYKNYNAENLADADLASEYAALIKETAPSIEGTWTRNEEIGNDCLQILTSYVLVMDSRTEVRLRVRSDRFTAEPAKDDFVIEAIWESAKGVPMSEKYYNVATAPAGEETYTQDSQSANAGRWEFYFAGCPAYDFRQVVTFKLYDPEAPDVDLGNEFSASFEQLISAGVTGGTFKGAELEMYKAMMNYSDAAREYFCN